MALSRVASPHGSLETQNRTGSSQVPQRSCSCADNIDHRLGRWLGKQKDRGSNPQYHGMEKKKKATRKDPSEGASPTPLKLFLFLLSYSAQPALFKNYPSHLQAISTDSFHQGPALEGSSASPLTSVSVVDVFLPIFQLSSLLPLPFPLGCAITILIPHILLNGNVLQVAVAHNSN